VDRFRWLKNSLLVDFATFENLDLSMYVSSFFFILELLMSVEMNELGAVLGARVA
jgi:hypothetical protein